MIPLNLAILLLIPVSCFVTATEPTEPNNDVFACRTERRVYLPYDQFKADVCARCYNYMPSSAFRLKFKYNKHHGVLLDPNSNTTHLADPFNNSSTVVADSFRDRDLAEKWKACCRAAWNCCGKMAKDPAPSAAGIHCPRTWDGWQCWPDTPAGVASKQPCQDHIYFETKPPSCTRYATKECLPNGTWYLNQHLREWTNYSKCGRRDEHRRFLTFHIATYIVSVVAIVPALVIFIVYKQLQVPRIIMHRNLFLSLLLNSIAVIIFKSSIIVPELNRLFTHPSILDSNGIGCKLLLILTKYFRMTNYMWMFCEGYYLHKLIAAAFAEQKSLLMFYGIGWAFPVLPVSIYAVLRATLENEKCWAFPAEQYEWIMNIPNLLSLVANLFFLCNIIRVLVTKLRATHANEPSQYRKAVRATLVLVPLFGLHFCLVLYRPNSGRCGFLEAYIYLNYAMDGLQGFLVAITFCYMNGEVLYLLKRSYQRYKLHLQIQGSMHSSAILRRLSTTQDSTMNDSQNHQNHHHSNRTKYMENKLREINNQTNSKTILNENCGRQ